MLDVAEIVLKKKKGKDGRGGGGGGGQKGKEEKKKKSGYCQATDIWGLGVVMFFTLGGYPPFIGDSV